jgi:hypothetical protein
MGPSTGIAMASRKNAMLTTEDRRWLTGEKTYEGEHAKQQRYQRRRDIRERVYNALLDFTILFEQLDAAEREKLFGQISADGTQWMVDDQAFEEGVCDALAFLLYSVGITRLMQPEETDHSTPTVAERLLNEALVRAGRQDDLFVEQTDLTVDAKPLALSGLLDDLEAGNPLSVIGIRLLLESEQVETAAVQECLRAMIFETNEQ